MHPLDVAKVRRLAEDLCDISSGRRLTTQGLGDDVAILIATASPHLYIAQADEVLERLLARADDRLGAEGMAAIIEAEICGPEANL